MTPVKLADLSTLLVPEEIDYVIDKTNFQEEIPPGTTHLTFFYGFNQFTKIHTIPSSVKTIDFGDNFNEPIQPGIIPLGVTRLFFGYSFNQIIEPGVLPSSLIELHFSVMYNHPFSIGSLPMNIKILALSNRYNHPLCLDSIPPNLSYLRIGGYFEHSIPDVILSRIYTKLIVQVYKKNRSNYLDKISFPFLPFIDDHEPFDTDEEFIQRILSSDQKRQSLFDRLKGIHQELIAKVFHPDRINRIASTFQIDFIDLMEIYS